MNKVLMVVSSYDTMPNGAATGAWLEELAASYYVFIDAGCDVTLASPRGGAGPLDPLSLDPPWLTAAGTRFRADARASAQLARTEPLASLRNAEFDALYCVGGAATAFDFPGDPTLRALVENFHAAGRPVAGVCHGVLGLTAARSEHGQAIVADHDVTGISNAEEALTGFDKLVPVLPETRLRELGARYSCAAPLECHVVVDRNVLTGQNPASAGPLAEAVLAQLSDAKTATRANCR
jgi:putative intracellular protease/amidase